MRKYFGVLSVAVLIIAALALAGCSGSGSRRVIDMFTPGDYYLGAVGYADTGDIALGYNDVTDRWAYFDSANDIGAFDDVSGGGVAIPGGSYVAAGPAFFDTNEDGWADFFSVWIRGITAEAANNDDFRGYYMANPGKIGAAAYGPESLVFDQYCVLFIPIWQNLANGTSVAVYRYVDYGAFSADQASGYWSYAGMGSVDDDPSGFGTKVVVFNWAGELGQFCAAVSVHSSGYGGT